MITDQYNIYPNYDDSSQYSRAIIVEKHNVIFLLNTNKINYLNLINIFSFDFQIRTLKVRKFKCSELVYIEFNSRP